MKEEEEETQTRDFMKATTSCHVSQRGSSRGHRIRELHGFPDDHTHDSVLLLNMS